MIKKLILGLLAFLPILGLQAQVQIGMEFERTKFIQHEPIMVTLQVVNNSGTQLIFGKADGKIEFLILSEVNQFSKIVLPLKADFNPAAGLILGAGETKNLSIQLNKHFSMANDVKYRVVARISHKMLSNAVETKDFTEIEVTKGVEVSTNVFGVPDVNNPNKVLTRKYTLLGFNADNNDIYCLKIHDDKWVYALHRLGPKVKGVDPQHSVDSFSNIHILMQLEPRIFMHTIFSPEGKLQQEVIYKASFDNVPRLIKDSDLGKITILDGIRAIEGVDYDKQGNSYKIKNR